MRELWRHVKSQAESILLTRLRGSSVAVDSKRSEKLQFYGDVVGFLRRKCGKSEVIGEADHAVVDLRESSVVTKETYFRMLWDKALLRETVFSDRLLKVFLIDAVLPRTRAETHQVLSLIPGRTITLRFDRHRL